MSHKAKASFFKHQVNVSVWVNHLRLNYLLKILTLVLILVTTFVLTWIGDQFSYDDEKEVKINVGPTFISVDRKWYFMSETISCSDQDFGREY
mmetsp:Transcript_28017/g.32100  ORF Transcript_28017/g.32100 Transcript_28017/m.32100 type:complete len:93 (+) Transcript_28017:330-608(+)